MEDISDFADTDDTGLYGKASIYLTDIMLYMLQRCRVCYAHFSVSSLAPRHELVCTVIASRLCYWDLSVVHRFAASDFIDLALLARERWLRPAEV